MIHQVDLEGSPGTGKHEFSIELKDGLQAITIANLNIVHCRRGFATIIRGIHRYSERRRGHNAGRFDQHQFLPIKRIHNLIPCIIRNRDIGGLCLVPCNRRTEDHHFEVLGRAKKKKGGKAYEDLNRELGHVLDHKRLDYVVEEGKK